MTALTLTFNFADQAHLDNAVGALSRRWGYKPQVADPHNLGGPKIDNPQAAIDFVKARLLQNLGAEVVNQLATEGAKVTLDQATAAAQAAAAQVTVS